MNALAVSCRNIGLYFPPTNTVFARKKKREGYWAIKDVSFEANRGDVVGIVGANGAGKSTLLSVISGIIAPDRGTVNTFDHTVMLLAINAGLSPALSGRKNIFLTGLTLGISRQTIQEKLGEIIAFSELGDFIDRPVSTYSTGMKSRLGFSTALWLEPDMFLIDEALGVGDRDFKKKSTEALRTKLSKNVTAVIVSHSEGTIKDLCNKAVLLVQGKSVAFGTPDEIFAAYEEI